MRENGVVVRARDRSCVRGLAVAAEPRGRLKSPNGTRSQTSAMSAMKTAMKTAMRSAKRYVERCSCERSRNGCCWSGHHWSGCRHPWPTRDPEKLLLSG